MPTCILESGTIKECEEETFHITILNFLFCLKFNTQTIFSLLRLFQLFLEFFASMYAGLSSLILELDVFIIKSFVKVMSVVSLA